MRKRAVIAAALFVASASWFLGCDHPPGTGEPTGTTRPLPEKRAGEARRPGEPPARSPSADSNSAGRVPMRG